MNPIPPLMIILAALGLITLAVPIMDAIGEYRYHNDPSHCEWCSIELARWRVVLLRRYCRMCGPLIYGDAGIYCQTGGPPCSRGARAGQTERTHR